MDQSQLDTISIELQCSGDYIMFSVDVVRSTIRLSSVTVTVRLNCRVFGDVLSLSLAHFTLSLSPCGIRRWPN